MAIAERIEASMQNRREDLEIVFSYDTTHNAMPYTALELSDGNVCFIPDIKENDRDFLESVFERGKDGRLVHKNPVVAYANSIWRLGVASESTMDEKQRKKAIKKIAVHRRRFFTSYKATRAIPLEHQPPNIAEINMLLAGNFPRINLTMLYAYLHGEKGAITKLSQLQR